MAVPTVRASGAWNVGTTSPRTATLPTHAEGDLLILEAASTSSGATVGTHGTPGGWTLVGTFPNTAGTRRGRVSVFARRAASAAETNPAVTFSTTGTSYQLRARAHSITAGTWNDTGTLADAWEDIHTAQASNSSTLAFSGFATTGTDRLCWASVHQCDNTATGITNSSTYAVRGANLDSGTGSDGFSHTAIKEAPTAGGQDVTFTFTAGGSITTAGILFGVLGKAAATYNESLTESATAGDSFAEGLTVIRAYTNGLSASTATTVSTATGIDAATGELVVVAANFGQESGGTLIKPTIGAVSGLSWTEAVYRSSGDGYGEAIIWYAQASSTITSQTITVTENTASAKTGALGVWVFQNHNGIGATASNLVWPGSSAINVTVNATATGSMLLGAFQGGGVTSLAARTDTAQDGPTYTGAGAVSVAVAHARGKTTGAGSVTLGYTTTDTYHISAAVEVKEATGGTAYDGATTEAASGSEVEAGALVIPAAVTDSALASDAYASAAAAASYDNAQAENALASDIMAGAGLQAGAQGPDTAVASDALAGGATQAASEAESATAAVSYASAIATVALNDDLAESATATDAFQSYVLSPAAAAESAVVLASWQGWSNQVSAASETATAADTYASELAGPSGDTATETATANDGYGCSVVMAEAQSEDAGATDTWAGAEPGADSWRAFHVWNGVGWV